MGILDSLTSLPAAIMKATTAHTVTYRTSSESYDAATGTNTRTPTDYTVTATAEDYPLSIGAPGTQNEAGIVKGDKKVSIPASEMTRIGVTPSTEDEVKIGGLWYGVQGIAAEPSVVQPLLWILQVRR